MTWRIALVEQPEAAICACAWMRVTVILPLGVSVEAVTGPNRKGT